jgi:hypothetical protein
VASVRSDVGTDEPGRGGLHETEGDEHHLACGNSACQKQRRRQAPDEEGGEAHPGDAAFAHHVRDLRDVGRTGQPGTGETRDRSWFHGD